MATMCVVCDERTADNRGAYCSDACYWVSVPGVTALKAKRALKARQVIARSAVKTASIDEVGSVPAPVVALLTAFATDDDMVDR